MSETRIYEIDDGGALHWVIAESPEGARQIWRSTVWDDGMSDEEVTEALVKEVSRERAERLQVFDEDGRATEAMWDIYRRDGSRQYLACSEW